MMNMHQLRAQQHNRLASGGRINRKRPLIFNFDGRSMMGYEGDTLASALLANGVDTSFSNLESLMGHDAFLVDYAHFNAHIVSYFDRVWFEDGLAD